MSERAERRRVIEVLRARVGFDAFVWLLTDPLTGVGTSPLAVVPAMDRLPELIRLRYRVRPRWSDLEPGRAVSLTAWARQLEEYGVRDVGTVTFGDRFGLWGVLDLWRTGATFEARELDALSDAAAEVTTALRRTQAMSLSMVPGQAPVSGGPAVLVLGPDLTPRAQTPETEEYLRALLPTEAGRPPVPAAAYNVGAQLLSSEAGLDDRPAVARAHVADGRWLTFRAARLGEGPDSDIAVTIGPTEPRERLELFARSHGLTDRETDVLRCLADGDDTQAIASRLFLSGFTVQDHLTAVFDKTGVRNRRTLLARAQGG